MMIRLLILAALLFAGCGADEQVGPPDMGQDQSPDMIEDTGTEVTQDRYAALGESTTVEVSGDDLRTYKFDTTTALRDNASRTRSVAETADDPRIRTGNSILDGLFAMAAVEARENSVESITDGAFNNGEGVDCSCFETGEHWKYVWTRDIGYSVDLGLAWIDPSRARRSLEFKLSERKSGGGLEIVQDTGTGGSWPVSSDRVVWAIGASTVLKHLSGAEKQAFSDLAYEALKNTAETDRVAVFNAEKGLYRGETSFLDWREQTYPFWMQSNFNELAGTYSLSTNVAHYVALDLLARLASDAGDIDEAARYRGWADMLLDHIGSEFQSADDGMLVSYLGDDFDPSQTRRFDALGLSLAAIHGIENGDGLLNYPMGENGPPVIHPQLPNVPIYHNRAIWPFVTAYVGLGAQRLGKPEYFEPAFESLVRGAALNLSNMENFEHTSLAAFYEAGDQSGPVLNSRRQLWSVAAFVGGVVEGLFGLKANSEGLAVSPAFPVELKDRWLSDEVTLENLLVPSGRVSVSMTFDDAGEGPVYRASTVSVDGAESDLTWGRIPDGAHIEVVMVRGSGGEPPAATDSPIIGREAEITSVSSVAGGIEVAIQADGPVDVYRDGVRVATDVEGTWTDTTAAATDSPCYSAAAPGASHSRANCYWADSAERRVVEFPAESFNVNGGYWGATEGRGHWVDWGDPDHTLVSSTLVARHTGEHWLQWSYSNGAGPLNTGITAAVKHMRVVHGTTGATLAERVISFPHTPTWSTWQDSQVLKVALTAGDSVQVHLSDFQNMSYFDHFRAYTGGEGGQDAVYNRVNLAALKVLVKAGNWQADVGGLVNLDGVDDLNDYAAAQRITPGITLDANDAFAMDWDDNYVYLTVRSAAFADPYKPVFVYLQDSDSLPAAVPSVGMTYSALQSQLPFTPTVAVSLRSGSDDGSQTGAWNGLWTLANGSFERRERLSPGEGWWMDTQNSTISAKLPRAAFPGRYIRLVTHVVNSDAGNEWKGVLPATHTPWTAGGGYYEIDLDGPHAATGWTLR